MIVLDRIPLEIEDYKLFRTLQFDTLEDTSINQSPVTRSVVNYL